MISPAISSATPMPITVATPTTKVRHCALKSARLIMVPRWTMMKPTETPPSASSDEEESRSSGKMPVRKPVRKMMEATNSEESLEFVFFATRSLTVQMAITMTNASTAFMGFLWKMRSENRRVSRFGGRQDRTHHPAWVTVHIGQIKGTSRIPTAP